MGQSLARLQHALKTRSNTFALLLSLCALLQFATLALSNTALAWLRIGYSVCVCVYVCLRAQESATLSLSCVTDEPNVDVDVDVGVAVAVAVNVAAWPDWFSFAC